MLGDGMGQLVSDDVDAAGEVVEELVAVPKDHLLALGIPDCRC